MLRRFPTGPSELYDLQRDPHERFNLFGQSELAAKQAEMIAKLEVKFEVKFATYADPQFDLWKGGRSKAKLHTPRE